MKSRNLFIGIIVLFIGVVALLASLNVISFSWHVALRLWPMLLILLGVSILPINDYVKSGLLVLLLGVGCLLYHNEAKNHPGWFARSNFSGNYIVNDYSDDDADDQGPYLQEFSEPFGTYSHATLDVDFGAGSFEIKPPCAELVTVKSDSDFVKYSFLVEKDDDEANIHVDGKGSANGLRDKLHNELDIAMNDAPIWSVNIETGAADCDFDFSPYKVEELDIEAGVCDMDIRLGNHGCDTKLSLESGVSNIKIEVPASMGCRIYIDSAITSKNFAGFEKTEKGVWQTYDYGSTDNNIVIELDCGVSNIEVERY